MGWLRRKKFEPLEFLPAEDRWTVAEGQHGGNRMLVRMNTSAKDYAEHPELPVRLGIAIPLHAPRPDGMPNDVETKQLGEIEDRLFGALGASGRVVLIISTNGMREFVSYVRTPDDAARVAQSVRAATTTHEVQHYVESDPKWDLFGQFTI